MPRRHRVPSYRRHKQSGQAIVTLTDGLGNRRDVLLGSYGSDESRAEYARVIAEWEASGRHLSRAPGAVRGPSINELILAYCHFIEGYYRHQDGTPTSEVYNIKLAMRALKDLYGHTVAAEFDTLALEAVRERYIRQGHCRNRINKDVARVKRLFRWAGARKMVPPEVYQALTQVEGLRAGRSEARETEPVRPVPEDVVEATLPFLTGQVAAMVCLQLATGMRPGEVAVIRGVDLDTSGDVWKYRPGSDVGVHGKHKTAWRGHKKVIFIGPRGQAVLRPWLRSNLTEYLFQPREAVAAFREGLRKRRKTGVPPAQKARRKQMPKRAPREQYTTSSYASAVAKGVQAANKARACESCKKLSPEERCAVCRASALPHWHPNQLRHTKATEIRRVAGLDAARAVLGHRSPQITEVYAELDASRAADIMERLG